MKNQQQIKNEIKPIQQACTASPVSLMDNVCYWLYYVALAHRGKPVFVPSRDAQYENSFIKTKYDKYCDKINSKLACFTNTEKIELPSFSLDELDPKAIALLMKSQIPFVIRNGAQGLGILDWDLDLLDEIAGDCEVPINEAKDQPSVDYTKPSKANLYYDFRRGPLSEVTASIRLGNSRARVSASENILYHANGRLRKDIGIERWEKLSGWNKHRLGGLKKHLAVGKVVTAQIVLQPGGAFTLWHMEPDDNFFVLAKGRKTWELAHPKYTAALRPRVKTSTSYIGSNIDFRENDEIQTRRGFNGYTNIPKIHIDLEPGDVLRVPNFWWHTASTCDQSYALATTVRAISDLNFVSPGCTALRFLDPQLKEIVKSIKSEGRIYDHHIGHPRKSRTQQEPAEVQT